MRKFSLIVFIFAISVTARASDDFNFTNWVVPENIYWNIPNRIVKYFEKESDKDKYLVNGRLNPVYLRLDIDGDTHYEYAVFIRNLKNKKDGILVCKINNQCQILFAGNKVRNLGPVSYSDDLKRIDFWKVDERKTIEKFPNLPTPPKKIGEGIMIGKSEAFSRILYWDGSEFVTYQLSE